MNLYFLITYSCCIYLLKVNNYSNVIESIPLQFSVELKKHGIDNMLMCVIFLMFVSSCLSLPFCQM